MMYCHHCKGFVPDVETVLLGVNSVGTWYNHSVCGSTMLRRQVAAQTERELTQVSQSESE